MGASGVVYGYPSPELEQAALEGKIVLAGMHRSDAREVGLPGLRFLVAIA